MIDGEFMEEINALSMIKSGRRSVWTPRGSQAVVELEMIPRGVTVEIPPRTHDAYICINDPTLITSNDFLHVQSCVQLE